MCLTTKTHFSWHDVRPQMVTRIVGMGQGPSCIHPFELESHHCGHRVLDTQAQVQPDGPEFRDVLYQCQDHDCCAVYYYTSQCDFWAPNVGTNPFLPEFWPVACPNYELRAQYAPLSQAVWSPDTRRLRRGGRRLRWEKAELPACENIYYSDKILDADVCRQVASLRGDLFSLLSALSWDSGTLLASLDAIEFMCFCIKESMADQHERLELDVVDYIRNLKIIQERIQDAYATWFEAVDIFRLAVHAERGLRDLFHEAGLPPGDRILDLNTDVYGEEDPSTFDFEALDPVDPLDREFRQLQQIVLSVWASLPATKRECLTTPVTRKRKRSDDPDDWETCG